MIAFEDLRSALTHWRIENGLPVADHHQRAARVAPAPPPPPGAEASVDTTHELDVDDDVHLHDAELSASDALARGTEADFSEDLSFSEEAPIEEDTAQVERADLSDDEDLATRAQFAASEEPLDATQVANITSTPPPLDEVDHDDDDEFEATRVADGTPTPIDD